MPNESFWTDLQSFYNRIPAIEQRRREARTSALAACASHLDQQLHGILQALNLGALAQRCSASVPALPSRRAEHLQDRERWQPFDGVFVRAFVVLDGRVDGQRRLALAGSEHRSEAQLSWHFDEARFRGFVPTVLLELVPESSVDRQTGQGNSYLLYLHADRIRIADSDALLHIADDLPALRRLSELYDGIAILSQVAREPLPVSPLPSLSKLQAYWQDVALPPAQKESLLRLVLRFLLNEPGAPRSVLLSGPTGVGKSLIARRLFVSTDGGLTDLDEVLNTDDRPRERARILGQYWSESERFSSGAEACRPNVLLLEDVEQWFPAESHLRTDRLISSQVQRCFVRRWDEAVTEARLPEGKRPWQEAPPARVLLVATTRDATALDPAIRARFDLEVTIALPDATLRDTLIRQRLDQVPSQSPLVDRDTDGTAQEATAIRALVSASQGLSGRELCSLFDAVDNSRSRSEHLQTVLESLQRRRQQNNPRVDSSAGWERLVLPDTTRETLMDLVFQLREAPTLRQAGFKPATAVLLYGPPGTGKTQSARTLANEAGLAFIAASTAELKAGYIGQSGERARALFAKARAQAPAILFLDELDAVAPDRDGGGGDSFTHEVVNQLLQELDGVHDHSDQPVLVIAATNRKEALDPAMLSRFRETLLLDLPTKEERLKLLGLLLASLTMEDAARKAMRDWVGDGRIEGVNRDRFSVNSPPASHRDIEQWVNRVLGYGVRRLRQGRSLGGNEAASNGTVDLAVTIADVLMSLGVECDAKSHVANSYDAASTNWKAAA